MKLTVPNKIYELTELYQAVAEEMGYSNANDLVFDCCKVNVAKNIQDGFYEYYHKVINEVDPHTSEDDARVQITIMLIMSGPKVDYALADNEVEVFDGFIH